MPDDALRLEVTALPGCAPARFAALGPALLADAEADPNRASRLVIADMASPALVLGRHQRVASCLNAERAAASGMPLVRRAAGGRTVRVGAGTVGVLLALPKREAVAGGGLPADKLLNRGIRGLLAGLTSLGAKGGAHYFGRDFVSADSRQLAAVGQDTTASAGLIEVLVSMREPLALPAELEGYPEHSDSRASGPPPVTLAELRGSLPPFEDVVKAITEGYARTYGFEVATLAPAAVELPLLAVEEDEAGWRESGVADVPIGFVEALVRTDGDRLTGARLRGDFMAPNFALRQLEQELVGAPLAFGDLGARVDAAFHRPGSFLLGVRELRVFADALLAAAESDPVALGTS